MPENMPKIAPAEVLEIQSAPEIPLEAEFDEENIVEAAEALLREGAPHDCDVLIIGAGPGGLACAQRLAQAGQNVAIVEREFVGGVCLNKGCIPTKTLLESVGALRLVRRAAHFGIEFSGEFKPDFGAMQARKREVVADLRAQTLASLEEGGVQIVRGKARFVEPHAVEIAVENGQTRKISAVHVVIATGGKPARLPFEGNDLEGVLTSDEILELEIVPSRLVVVGGGAIGVEFAAIFAELGAQVTLLEKESALLPGEDEDIQKAMRESLESSKIEVLTDCSIEKIELQNGVLQVNFARENAPQTLETDLVLLATGRAANIEDLELEKVGIETQKGAVFVDEDKQTSVGGVWAIGDCIRRVGWAHQAALEGKIVADAILGLESDVDSRFVPSCYYTFPEVATVGLTLETARELDIEATVGKCHFRHNGRANTSGDNGGFVKMVVEIGTGKLLGAQIIGPRATELINEIAITLREGATAEKFADSLHAHPTFAEVLPGAARAALGKF